ncbi:8858_t:CDS:1, partial [Ambispora gerdemannii]
MENPPNAENTSKKFDVDSKDEESICGKTFKYLPGCLHMNLYFVDEHDLIEFQKDTR